MTRIDLDQLATVVGGLAAAKPVQPAAKLTSRRIGDTKIINNLTANQMYWESKPF